MVKKSNKKTYKARELIERLRKRYENEQQYAFFEQVANGTGWKCRSWVDAAVLSLWPSDGLTRRAFEVKISRSDFLNELQNPTKNAWAKEYFHEFWFVAPADVIKEEELPEGAGWLCPRGNEQLVIKRHASHVAEPKMDSAFLASLARSIGKLAKLDDESLKKKILDKSREYNQGLAYKKAVNKFLNEHGKYVREYHEDRVEQEVYEYLNAITTGDKAKKIHEQIESNLSSFQRRMLEMYDAMTVLVFTSILETDEMGRFVNDVYGYSDKGMTIAKKRAKKRSSRFGKSAWEQMLDTFDFMKERIEILTKE